MRHKQPNPIENYYLLFLFWIAVSWLLCGLIGSLSLVFSDVDHVTSDYNDGVAPSCVITSGYYHSNYVVTVTGCILVMIFGIWLCQVCFDKALRFHNLIKYVNCFTFRAFYTQRTTCFKLYGQLTRAPAQHFRMVTLTAHDTTRSHHWTVRNCSANQCTIFIVECTRCFRKRIWVSRRNLFGDYSIRTGRQWQPKRPREKVKCFINFDVFGRGELWWWWWRKHTNSQ